MNTFKRKLNTGISGCLFGQNVRYDATHRYNENIILFFSPKVSWVHFCPEYDAGMNAPRETIQLIGTPSHPQIIATLTGINRTTMMIEHCQKEIDRFKDLQISGFILKARSPSCGVLSPIFDENGTMHAQGKGLFVKLLQEELKGIPVASEEDLLTLQKKENFFSAMQNYAQQCGY